MTSSAQASALSPVDEDLVADASMFADTFVSPDAEQWDRERTQPEAVLRSAIARFTPTAIPKDLGGKGGNFSTLVRVYEELARRDLGFASALAVHTNVAVAISLTPRAAVRDRFLPRLLSGEAIGAFLLTEPGAGSDATAITTEAKARPGGYRITGRKAWVTNGQNADVLATFCQTSPGSGAKGIAGLVLEASSSGVVATPMLDLIGSHAMGTTDILFEDVDVGLDALAFGPGEAFKAAMFGIDVARVGVAAMCNGALQGALMVATSYASERRAFGKPLLQHQGLQWRLAEVATNLEASRGLTFQASRLLDSGQDPTVMAAHAKKYATRESFAGISECMRALGANGLKREFGLARQLAAARVTECMDGTGEILNIVIGRSLGVQR